MRDSFYTAIDIGTSKVSVLVSRVGSEGDLKVFGTGILPSEGIQRGRVENIDEAQASVSAALKEGQRYMRTTGRLGSYVSVSGSHITSVNRREFLSNYETGEEISPNMLDSMLRGSFPKVRDGEQVLHVIPIGYTVDGLSGVRNPLGLAGNTIEVDSHVVVGDAIVLQNTVNAVECRDAYVRSLVLQGIASAEATLTGDEREMGVMLLDIGAGTTDIVMYRHGSPWFSDVLPVGGDALTRDLAAAMGSTFQMAEQVKIDHGAVNVDDLDDGDIIEDPEMEKRWNRPIPRKAVAEPLHARMLEIIKLALTRVRQGGLGEWPVGGIVLTGGGSLMEGLPELVKKTVGGPVRIGYPYGIVGLPSELRNPTHSAAVGLLLWGIKHQDSVQKLNGGSSNSEPRTRRWRFGAPSKRKTKTEVS